jgi:hypothetical protein
VPGLVQSDLAGDEPTDEEDESNDIALILRTARETAGKVRKKVGKANPQVRLHLTDDNSLMLAVG